MDDPGPESAEIRFLVVDDDRFMLDILPRWIQKTFQGTRRTSIVTARTPAEVLVHLRNGCPDVVLSDYDLRDAMNGVRLLERVSETCPATVRVLFSGHSPEEIGDDLRSTCLHGFLEKPMRLADMMDPLRKIIDRELSSAG